jgi:hypothetical protein
MTLDRLLVLALLAMGILVVCYLARFERMKRLGEALYQANGEDLEASYLAVRNCELEADLVARGAQGKSPAKIWRDSGKAA